MNREETVAKIHEALDEIRPFLKSDGGDISLVELTDEYVAKVQFHGACTGCSVNQMTLKSGVEMTIQKFVPHVIRVEEVAA
jgi:Fe-S cluster biogenesis protein NfuA